MAKINLTILFFLFVLLSVPVSSQSLADTSFLSVSIANAKIVYFQFVKGNAHLYNGSEHKFYQTVEEEHPYFISSDWGIGSVVYDNDQYENVNMVFDLRNDKVIAEHYSGSGGIELVSKKVSEFTLQGHTFVALKPDSDNQIHEGFYDRLYNGTTKVYAKRTKQYQERIEANTLHPSFSEKNAYFLFVKGKYFLANSKGSALGAFGDKKKMLKQYLSKSRIRYNKEKEKALVNLAEYHDTLKD